MFSFNVFALWPVDSITKWLSTSTEHWEWPKDRIVTEDLSPVARRSDIVLTDVILILVFKILDRCLALKCQIDVESKEHSDQYGNNSVQHVSYLDYYIFCEGFRVFFRFVVVVFVNHPVNAIEPCMSHREDYEVCDNENIDKKQYEEFAVPKADTVINPRAVVIHIEYATTTT